MTQLLKISIFIWNIFQYRHVGHIQRSRFSNGIPCAYYMHDPPLLHTNLFANYTEKFSISIRRSHLRDIRDRSVLRLFESTDGVTGMPGPLGIPGTGTGLPPHWEDQSYFSEPEFDSEYQHQHIHKSKVTSLQTFAKFIVSPFFGRIWSILKNFSKLRTRWLQNKYLIRILIFFFIFIESNIFVFIFCTTLWTKV